MFYETTELKKEIAANPKVHEKELVVFFKFFFKRRKSALLVLVFLMTAVSAAFYYTSYYVSSIKITYTATFQQKDDFSDYDINNGLKQSASFKRIFQIVNSDELMDYMAQKFDLYNYYHITNDSKGKAEYYKKFRRQVMVKSNLNDVVSVTVEDKRNAELPSLMANELGKKIQEINRKWFLSQISQKVEIGDSMRTELLKKMESNRMEIESYLSRLENLKQFNSKENEKVASVAERIFISSNAVLDQMKEIAASFTQYKWLELTTREDNFNQFRIIESANPQKLQFKIHPYVFIFTLVAICPMLTIALMYGWLHLQKFKNDLLAS